MSINSLIIEHLTPLAPTASLHYFGSEKTYITFFEYGQRGTLFGDDEEIKTSYFIQVDIWSNTDYTNLVMQVKSVLKGLGFSRQTEYESFEKDTLIYHKATRWIYTN